MHTQRELERLEQDILEMAEKCANMEKVNSRQQVSERQKFPAEILRKYIHQGLKSDNINGRLRPLID